MDTLSIDAIIKKNDRGLHAGSSEEFFQILKHLVLENAELKRRLTRLEQALYLDEQNGTA